MKKSVVINAVLIFLFLALGAARAATFVVTKTADTNDGACDADCSLREAVAAAANSPQSSDVIEFSAFFDVQRWIVLDLQSSPGVYVPLSITKSLEIRGKGSNTLAVDGGGNTMLFEIHTPSGSPVPNVVLRDLQFTQAAGAIYNEDGNLTIESCLFLENYLEGSKYGGAALHHHSGALVINNSTFDGNVNPDSTGTGGAVSLYTGTATIANSTFVGNAGTHGGAFYSEFGTSNFINSTISYNAGLPTPEASYVVTTANGTINMTNVTVTQNRIRSNGSAVGRQWNTGQNAQINIKNTIVAGNVVMPGLSGLNGGLPFGINPTDVNGVTSLGHNLVGFAFPNDGFPVGLPNAAGDYVGTYSAPLDPLLGQLDDNGGLTETMALLPGSPALDHGTSIGAPPTDQRGVARPQGAAFDIGAFESEQTPPLRIVTEANLPDGAVNQFYSLPIVAADGTPPYNFTLAAQTLPNGLTLSSSGLLSGTPTDFGTFSLTIVVEDADFTMAQKTFQLTIAPPPLQILTSVLPNGNRNQPFSIQLIAAGGVPPYVFSQSGGALPNGINLSSSGLLSGTPAESGSFNFDVTVTDNSGASVQKNLFLTVFPALTITTNANLPTGLTNQFYSRQMTADGGISPYGFSLAGGALPNGFTLSAGGVLSGTASPAGAFSFVVEAADSQGIRVQKTFNLTISDLYVVTTAADTNDGVCDAQCSLREAVAAGDSIPGASNVIEFSTFFDNPVRIFLNSSINVNKTTEIRGKGLNKTRISSANPVSNTGSKFRISGTADAVFRDLTMDDGGFFTGTRSIENRGSGRLTIQNSLFKGSYVTDDDGGAILQTAGTLIVDNSTFAENYIEFSDFNCARRGAAIAILNGAARITNSTFKYNASTTASTIYANGALTIENSTFAYNSSATPAACSLSPSATILNETGSVSIINSTIVENSVNGVAAAALSGNITVGNSIVARNFRTGGGPITSPNIGAGVVSLGHNLIGYAPPMTAGLPNANLDYVGTAAAPLDPLLDVLAFNGGETETCAPQVGSLSINNGTSADAPAADQRGVARPVGAGVDIGAFETDVPVISGDSPAGTNVNVPLGSVSVTFSNVDTAGTTTQIPIYPAISGTLPGGFSFGAGFPAFQITTTANYSGPLLVCIQVPNVNTQTFNTLRLLHNENGALVDRTVSRDNATRTICAQTTSLSPFAVAQSLMPTAASVSISGRILTAEGGLRNAIVVLTDQAGAIRTTRTTAFGYYRFDSVAAGQTVTVAVRSRRFQFAPRIVFVGDGITGLDFTADP